MKLHMHARDTTAVPSPSMRGCSATSPQDKGKLVARAQDRGKEPQPVIRQRSVRKHFRSQGSSCKSAANVAASLQISDLQATMGKAAGVHIKALHTCQ